MVEDSPQILASEDKGAANTVLTAGLQDDSSVIPSTQ